MRPARTALAVAVGYLALLILTIFGDLFLAAALHGRRSGPGLIIGNEVVVFIAAVFGGAIAARIGGARPIAHGVILGIVVLIVGVAVSAGSHHTNGAPSWYSYSIAVLAGAGAFFGGVLAALAKPNAA